MVDAARPDFRFYPGAYVDGQFLPGDSCDVCGRHDAWLYQGGIYTSKPRPAVCAPCIAQGRLSEFLGEARFALHDVEVEGARPELAQELLQRTPGVACFNPFDWPVADGVPLAFVGYGEKLWDDPAARAAMEGAWREQMGEALDGPSPYLLVFRQVDGPGYAAVIDFD